MEYTLREVAFLGTGRHTEVWDILDERGNSVGTVGVKKEVALKFIASEAMYEALKECLAFLDLQREEYNNAMSVLPRPKVGRGPLAEKAAAALAQVDNPSAGSIV